LGCGAGSGAGSETKGLGYEPLALGLPETKFDTFNLTAYYSSAADDEITARRNQNSWQLVSFRPRVLRDVKTVNLSTTMLGFSSALPVFISPAALGKLAHPDGEKALARAAGKAGLIYMVQFFQSQFYVAIDQCTKSR